MRADRLVAILLTLQVRGRCTAAELAAELESSERTIRRDLEALGVAGVPLYSQRGRGGGWTLLGGSRMNLAGLTADEARALVLATLPGLAAIPAPGALDAARRKLLAALPEPFRAEGRAVQSAVLVDPSPWRPGPEPATTPLPSDEAFWAPLREAVLANVQVVLSYEPPGRPVEERRVQPLGLVQKQGRWYLLARAPAGLRTYRLSRVRDVVLTDQVGERPGDFDLAASWADVRRGLVERSPPPVIVEVAVSPGWLGPLRAMIGAWWPITERGSVDVEDLLGGSGPAATDEPGEGRGEGDESGAGYRADGRNPGEAPDRGDPVRATGPGDLREGARQLVSIRFASAGIAAAELARLADHVEVLAPPVVRDELGALGRRLVARYGGACAPARRATCVR